MKKKIVLQLSVLLLILSVGLTLGYSPQSIFAQDAGDGASVGSDPDPGDLSDPGVDPGLDNEPENPDAGDTSTQADDPNASITLDGWLFEDLNGNAIMDGDELEAQKNNTDPSKPYVGEAIRVFGVREAVSTLTDINGYYSSTPQVGTTSTKSELTAYLDGVLAGYFETTGEETFFGPGITTMVHLNFGITKPFPPKNILEKVASVCPPDATAPAVDMTIRALEPLELFRYADYYQIVRLGGTDGTVVSSPIPAGPFVQSIYLRDATDANHSVTFDTQYTYYAIAYNDSGAAAVQSVNSVTITTPKDLDACKPKPTIEIAHDAKDANFTGTPYTVGRQTTEGGKNLFNPMLIRVKTGAPEGVVQQTYVAFYDTADPKETDDTTFLTNMQTKLKADPAKGFLLAYGKILPGDLTDKYYVWDPSLGANGDWVDITTRLTAHDITKTNSLGQQTIIYQVFPNRKSDNTLLPRSWRISLLTPFGDKQLYTSANLVTATGITSLAAEPIRIEVEKNDLNTKPEVITFEEE